jgi:hypothetical protein
VPYITGSAVCNTQILRSRKVRGKGPDSRLGPLPPAKRGQYLGDPSRALVAEPLLPAPMAKKKKKKKLHLSSREGMMRCPQNTQKPKLQRTTRGGQTKVKNKKEPAKRGRGEGKKKKKKKKKKKGGGGEQPHTWPRPSQRSRLKSARAWNASEIKETTARKSACQMNCRRDLEGPLNNWG